MANREAAERACKDPNPIIDGRKANVNLAYLGAKPRGIQTGMYLRTDFHAQIIACRTSVFKRFTTFLTPLCNKLLF